MPLLEIPDAFQIEVPEDWEATAIPGYEYTLNPRGASELKLTIVVYEPRGKKDATPPVAAAAVRTYAKSIGMERADKLSVLTPTGGEIPRAFASIPGEERNTYVGFFFFKASFVVAAGSAPADDRAGFARVEQMVWSISAA